MGRLGSAVGAALLLVTTACGPGAHRERPSENLLVLELGGDHPSLTDALVRLGAIPQPRPETQPETQPETRPETRPETPAQPPAHRVDPQPQPQPAPPRIVKVILEKGQTLSALAREHLGDANRWPEIAEHNGWTERELRQLPPGTTVQILIEGR